MIILMRCCSMHILWSKINRTVTTREVLESFSSSINSMLAMLDLTFSWRDLLTKHRSSSLSACACSSWQGLEASSVVFSFFKTRNWTQFPVRTWIQVVSTKKKTGLWLAELLGLLAGNTTWTLILTGISEKTELEFN